MPDFVFRKIKYGGDINNLFLKNVLSGCISNKNTAIINFRAMHLTQPLNGYLFEC